MTTGDGTDGRAVDRSDEHDRSDGRGHGRRRTSLSLTAVLAAALWLVSGTLSIALTWDSLLPDSVHAALPATLPFSPWVHPWGWGLATTALAALLVAVVVRVLVPLADRVDDRVVRVVVVWFAVVVAGSAAGAALDLATIVGALPAPRLRMTLDGLGDGAAVGAWWGVVQGWLPASVAVGHRRGPVRPPAADAGRRVRPVRRAGVPALLTGLAVLAAAAVVTSGALGHRAERVAAAQEAAVADGASPDEGALPDPYAQGTPVPTTAPGRDVDRDPSWCTADQAMMLIGDPGAASGHRARTMRLVNTSDAPCVVDGYPDIAFGDQNGHELQVDVEHGGSFLAEDPGPSSFELAAGATATAAIGWEAGATSEALVARTLYGAPFPTDPRGSWPFDSDLVAGSVVHVTAWALDTTTPVVPS